MVNNNLKISKNKLEKMLFASLILIYRSGICCGSIFALKSQDNLDFISNIIFNVNDNKIQNTGFLGLYSKNITRDIIYLLCILIMKYAGILKGLCICIPFIMSIQNAVIYMIKYLEEGSVFALIRFILKDTAVSFMVLLFCYVVVTDIIYEKYEVKKDIKKLTVYISGIIIIYIIEYTIRIILT